MFHSSRRSAPFVDSGTKLKTYILQKQYIPFTSFIIRLFYHLVQPLAVRGCSQIFIFDVAANTPPLALRLTFLATQ